MLKQNPPGLAEGAEQPRIFLYTHYDGWELPSILQAALVRGKERWDDEQYLGRIIFSELTQRYPMGLIGYGLTTYECDGGYALLVVDAEKQTVEIEGSSQYGGGLKFTFDEYVAIDFSDDAWDCLAQKLAA